MKRRRSSGPASLPDCCKEFVRGRAAVDFLYFSSVGAASGAVGDYIDAEIDLDTKLTDAIEHTASGETYLKGDVYESELRSHRLGLESLRGAWPRLHVEPRQGDLLLPLRCPSGRPHESR